MEIIIVVAVFGLVATLWAISWNGARAQLRDAQRLSDVSLLRSALSQYWLEKASYPISEGVNLADPGTNTDGLTQNGFAGSSNATGMVYLPRVPQGPKSGEYYRYKGSATGYSIRFQTERDSAFGKANVYYAHTTGIDGKDELK